MAQKLPGGPGERQEVDAGMPVEAAILVGLEEGEEARIDLLDIGGEPPAPLGRREGPQQPAVAVQHDRRAMAGLREVEGGEVRGDAPEDEGSEEETQER